jgi:hypothetical protein
MSSVRQTPPAGLAVEEALEAGDPCWTGCPRLRRRLGWKCVVLLLLITLGALIGLERVRSAQLAEMTVQAGRVAVESPVLTPRPLPAAGEGAPNRTLLSSVMAELGKM